MAALFFYELTEWYKIYFKKTLIFLSAIVFILLSVSFLKPEIFFIGLNLILTLTAVFAGYEKNDFKKNKILSEDLKINKIKIFFSKKALLLILSFFYLLFITPFFITLIAIWGIKFYELLKILLILTAVFITTSNVVKLVLTFETENKILHIIYFLLLFYILPLFLPIIKFLSPFYTTLSIIKNKPEKIFIFFIFYIILNLILNYLEYKKNKL